MTKANFAMTIDMTTPADYNDSPSLLLRIQGILERLLPTVPHLKTTMITLQRFIELHESLGAVYQDDQRNSAPAAVPLQNHLSDCEGFVQSARFLEQRAREIMKPVSAPNNPERKRPRCISPFYVPS